MHLKKVRLKFLKGNKNKKPCQFSMPCKIKYKAEDHLQLPELGTSAVYGHPFFLAEYDRSLRADQ